MNGKNILSNKNYVEFVSGKSYSASQGQFNFF